VISVVAAVALSFGYMAITGRGSSD